MKGNSVATRKAKSSLDQVKTSPRTYAPMQGLFIIYGESWGENSLLDNIIAVAMNCNAALKLANMELEGQFDGWIHGSNDIEFRPTLRVEYHSVESDRWRDVARALALVARCRLVDENDMMEDYRDDDAL